MLALRKDKVSVPLIRSPTIKTAYPQLVCRMSETYLGHIEIGGGPQFRVGLTGKQENLVLDDAWEPLEVSENKKRHLWRLHLADGLAFKMFGEESWKILSKIPQPKVSGFNKTLKLLWIKFKSKNICVHVSCLCMRWR